MAYGLTGASGHKTFNKLLFSLNKQVGSGSFGDATYFHVDNPATLAKCFLVNSTLPDFQPGRVITDAGRSTGYLEPSTMKTSGRRVPLPIQHDDPPSGFLALMLAFGLAGTVSKTTTATGVFKYSIALRTETQRNPPYITTGWRAGKTLARQVHSGMSVNQFTLSQAAEAGAYLAFTGAILGTGRRTMEPTVEIVAAAQNSTSLDIAGTLNGSDNATWMASIHKILCDYSDNGTYSKEVAFTSCEDSNTINYTAPGAGTDTVNFKIIYVSSAAASGNLALIDSLTPTETDAFNLSHLSSLIIGGEWNGSSMTNGWNLRDSDSDGNCHFDGLAWTFNSNNQERSCAGGSGDHIDIHTLGNPTQSVSLGRYMMDWLWQHLAEGVKMTSLFAQWNGELIDATNRHYLKVVFPRLKGAKADIDVSGEYNKENWTLTPMAGGTYPTVIVEIQTDLDGIMGL